MDKQTGFSNGGQTPAHGNEIKHTPFQSWKEVVYQQYGDVVNNELLSAGLINYTPLPVAIENREFDGFLEDYHILHCLIRRHRPMSIFEVGTNMGTGTKILKNAWPPAQVFSLDLPTEECHKSLQHPINEGKGDRVGQHCDLPFVQLRGDSMTFDFSSQPCEAYFIDGEHDRLHAEHETRQALQCRPKLIVWHDSDIPAVWDGITQGLQGDQDYTLYRVQNTRMAYAVKK